MRVNRRITRYLQWFCLFSQGQFFRRGPILWFLQCFVHLFTASARCVYLCFCASSREKHGVFRCLVVCQKTIFPPGPVSACYFDSAGWAGGGGGGCEPVWHIPVTGCAFAPCGCKKKNRARVLHPTSGFKIPVLVKSLLQMCLKRDTTYYFINSHIRAMRALRNNHGLGPGHSRAQAEAVENKWRDSGERSCLSHCC